MFKTAPASAWPRIKQRKLVLPWVHKLTRGKENLVWSWGRLCSSRQGIPRRIFQKVPVGGIQVLLLPFSTGLDNNSLQLVFNSPHFLPETWPGGSCHFLVPEMITRNSKIVIKRKERSFWPGLKLFYRPVRKTRVTSTNVCFASVHLKPSTP